MAVNIEQYSDDEVSGSSTLNSEDEQSHSSAYSSAEAVNEQQDSPGSRKTVDDDEDKKKPQYIPKRGNFYEHDDRAAAEQDNAAAVVNPARPVRRVGRNVADRWQHDMFDMHQQAPKSMQELRDHYGYDIRADDMAPRGKRNRRYGRGPSKYTRSWDDEDAYARPASRGRGAGRGRGDSRGRRPNFFAGGDHDAHALGSARRTFVVSSSRPRAHMHDQPAYNSPAAAGGRRDGGDNSRRAEDFPALSDDGARDVQRDLGVRGDSASHLHAPSSSRNSPRAQVEHQQQQQQRTRHSVGGAQRNQQQQQHRRSDRNGGEVAVEQHSARPQQQQQQQSGGVKRYSSQRQRQTLPPEAATQPAPTVFYGSSEAVPYTATPPPPIPAVSAIYTTADHSGGVVSQLPAESSVSLVGALYEPPAPVVLPAGPVMMAALSATAPPPSFAPVLPPPATPPMLDAAAAAVTVVQDSTMLPVVESGGVTYYNMHAQPPPVPVAVAQLAKRPTAAIPIVPPRSDNVAATSETALHSVSIEQELDSVDIQQQQVENTTCDSAIKLETNSVEEDVAELSDNVSSEFNTPPSGISPSHAPAPLQQEQCSQDLGSRALQCQTPLDDVLVVNCTDEQLVMGNGGDLVTDKDAASDGPRAGCESEEDEVASSRQDVPECDLVSPAVIDGDSVEAQETTPRLQEAEDSCIDVLHQENAICKDTIDETIATEDHHKVERSEEESPVCDDTTPSSVVVMEETVSKLEECQLEDTSDVKTAASEVSSCTKTCTLINDPDVDVVVVEIAPANV